MINGIVKYDMWSELNNNMRCFEILLTVSVTTAVPVKQ